MRNWICVGGLTCAVALSLGACLNFNTPPDSAANGAGAGGSPMVGNAGSPDGDAGAFTAGGKSDGGAAPQVGGKSNGGSSSGGSVAKGGSPPSNAGSGAVPVVGSAGAPDPWGDGGTYGTDEPTLLGSCSEGHTVTTSNTATLAVSKTYNLVGLQLYTWDSTSSAAAVRWSDSGPSHWFPWYCFDNLPNITHLAAMNLPANGYAPGQPEVFAASSDGVLLVRRGDYNVTWTVWLPFSLPSPSTKISDISALGASDTNARPRVFIVDRGRVFVRTKVADDTYADYGPWAALPENDAKLVSAAERADGGQQVVTIGGTGQLKTAVQTSNAQAFGSWQALSGFDGAPVDLEVADAGAAGLRVFVLDQSGAVWSMTSDDTNATLSTLVSSTGPAQIVAITARSVGHVPQLYGIDSSGKTYQLVGNAWAETPP